MKFEKDMCKVVQPLLINNLTKYFKSTGDAIGLNEAIVYGVLNCLALFFYTIMHHMIGYQSNRYGMQIKIATCGLAYRKVILSLLL